MLDLAPDAPTLEGPDRTLDRVSGTDRDAATTPELSPAAEVVARGFDLAYERPGQATAGEFVQGLVSDEARSFGTEYAIAGVERGAYVEPADPAANGVLVEALRTPMGRDVLLPSGLTGQTPQELAQGRPLGDDIVVLLDREAAAGFGHTAVMIGNDVEGWDLFSKDGTSWVGGVLGPGSRTNDAGRGQTNGAYSRSYDTLDDFFQDAEMSKFYEAAVRVEFEGGADRGDAARAAAEGILREPYDVLTSSCASTVEAALQAVQSNPDYGISGFQIHESYLARMPWTAIRPEVQFTELGRQEGGDDVRSDAQLAWERRSEHDGF